MSEHIRTAPAKVGIHGLANLLITNGEQMGQDQYLRELVVNVAQNGGDQVIIDSWTDPETEHQLMRVSDNARGMTAKQLRSHIGTLLSSSHGYGRNFGWGSRVSTLAHNPAGVDYASRTKEGDNFLRMHVDRGVIGSRVWELENGGSAEVIDPFEGQLARVTETGTAVILNGNGRQDTYSEKISYRATDFIAKKFFEYPETSTGNPLEVRAFSHGGLRRILPIKSRLEAISSASGELAFETDSYAGRIRWAVLPTVTEQVKSAPGPLAVPTGVAALCEGEIFAMSRADLGFFGVPYASIKSRLLVLVEVEGARMNPERSAVVFHKRGRRSPILTPPWREIGGFFAAHMPKEIEDLINERSGDAKTIDAVLAARLDKNFLKRLRAVPVKLPGGDDTGSGAEEGSTVPTSDTIDRGSNSGNGGSKGRAVRRDRSGNDAAHEALRRVLPSVEFVERSEIGQSNPYGIEWNEALGKMLVAKDLASYRRAISNFVADTGEAEALVEEAVKTAFSLELAATVIDARGSADAGLTESEIEALLTPSALFAKLLGCQSIDSLIRSSLTAVKADA